MYVMKYLSLFFALLLGTTLSELQARDKGDEKLAITVSVDKPVLTLGDSCVVTFIIQSPYPILKVESKDEPESTKRARLQRLPTRRRVRRTFTQNGVIHSLVWARYIVSPTTDGEISIPACGFKAELLNPAGNGKRRTFKVKANSEKLKIVVKEKPQPTMRDLLRQGRRVI